MTHSENPRSDGEKKKTLEFLTCFFLLPGDVTIEFIFETNAWDLFVEQTVQRSRCPLVIEAAMENCPSIDELPFKQCEFPKIP
jgi:hypothetical protein